MEVSDKLDITLKLGTTTYNMTIDRSEEEYYRNAEKLINQRYTFYANHFPNKTPLNFLQMSLIEIAYIMQKAQVEGNLTPIMDTLSNLSGEIEEVLK